MARKNADGKTTGTRGRKAASPRTVRAAGLATTMLAGALVTAIAAPAATAVVSPSALLASSESSLQPVIDQILAEMQRAVTADSALPFAAPESNALLPNMLQNLEFVQLMLALHAQSPNLLFSQTPDVVNGDAADVRQFPQLDNNDVFYNITQGLDPNASYVISGTFSKGTEELSINTNAITSTGSTTVGSLELESGLKVNPDGTYTVEIAPTEPSGAVNYVSDAGANFLLVRSTMGNWAAGPSTVNIECVADCPAATPGVTDTGLSPAAISSVLNALAEGTPRFNATAIALAKQGGIIQPENTMAPFENASQGVIGAAAAQGVSTGNFDLQPGQALIVKVPDVDANYGGITLYTAWGQTLPYPLALNSLNNTQAFHDPDGFTYYVVSATNPGVANWLDTGGLQNGEVYARYLNLAPGTDPEGLPVTTQVVPVADVSKYLPDDTPTVSPEQYAADMNERVLSYDYAMDVARTSNSSWVTEQLWLHDLQDAMGAKNFDEVFGEEASTPMWLRLTPALSPDWTTVAKDFMADPSGGMAAIRDNLALAEKDISLPVKLAEALLQQDFTQTAQSVQADLSSGDFSQALQDLATGGQRLASILNEALFDPNTSITAGMFNARDDLATAVMAAAKDGFGSQAGSLATWEWQHMSELTQLTSGNVLTDLGALFHTADVLGG